jgi:hypothetical protein
MRQQKKDFKIEDERSRSKWTLITDHCLQEATLKPRAINDTPLILFICCYGRPTIEISEAKDLVGRRYMHREYVTDEFCIHWLINVRI